jgi:hypothetical protein
MKHRARNFLMGMLLPLLACAAAVGAEPKSELPAGAVCVPFTIESNRLFITAKVNGTAECRCIIDTGSEVTLLNKARVKVPLRIRASEQLQGDFVGAIDSQRAVLDSLALGAHVSKNLAVGVIDHGEGKKLAQIEMLLGMDFLSRQRFSLDFEKQQMILWPLRSELPKPAEKVERSRLRAYRGASGSDDPRMRLVAGINQKTKATFMLDTAADTPMYVIDKPLKEYGFDGNATAAGKMGINDNGKQQEARYFNVLIKRFDFDKTSFADVAARALDVSAIKNISTKTHMNNCYNIVGLPFLRTIPVIHFDAPASAIYFDRKKE